jgi:hypothetical protein
MENVHEVAVNGQAAHLSDNSSEIEPKRNVGIEIALSVSLPSSFYKKFNAASFAICNELRTRALRRVLR